MSESGENKRKPHIFKCSVKWTSGRQWDVISSTGLVIKGGSPQAFGGTGNEWSPEELLLASINTCHLSAFYSYSNRKGFEFVSYESEVEGVLEHDGTKIRYTKIVVRPKLVVKSEADIETGVHYIQRAHTMCFMADSVKAEVIVEPEVTAV
jgi:organic hydroperoxide reductase OsmC/OhrA